MPRHLTDTRDFSKEEIETLFEKAIVFALEINDLFSLGILELNRGWEYAFKGDANTAIEHFQKSIHYCEEGQIVNLLVVTWIGFGWSYWLLGDLEKATKYMEKGLKAQIEVGVEYDSGLFYALAALVDLDRGDQRMALQRTEKALQIAERYHQHGEGFIWMVMGRILGKSAPLENERAEEAILRGIKILEDLVLVAYYAPGYYWLGEFYMDTGQKDKAINTLNKARDFYRRMEMEFWFHKTSKMLKALDS